MHRGLLRASTAASVCGCASPPLAVYEGEPPRRDLRRSLEGTVDAHGLFAERPARAFMKRAA